MLCRDREDITEADRAARMAEGRGDPMEGTADRLWAEWDIDRRRPDTDGVWVTDRRPAGWDAAAVCCPYWG